MAVAVSSVQVTPRKVPRQERARILVDAILTAAEQLSRVGIDGWTTNHVAERAGVSIGSLYQYFPSKESLVSALYTRHRSARLDAFAEALNQTTSLGEHAARALLGGIAESHALERALRSYLIAAAADRRLRQVDGRLATIIAAHLQRIGWDECAARRVATPIATAINAVAAQLSQDGSGLEEPPRLHEIAAMLQGLLTPAPH